MADILSQEEIDALLGMDEVDSNDFPIYYFHGGEIHEATLEDFEAIYGKTFNSLSMKIIRQTIKQHKNIQIANEYFQVMKQDLIKTMKDRHTYLKKLFDEYNELDNWFEQYPEHRI